MKKLMLILIGMLFIVGCNNPEKKMSSCLETKVKKELLAPDTYKKLKFEIDTISVDSVLSEIKTLEESNELCVAQIKHLDSMDMYFVKSYREIGMNYTDPHLSENKLIFKNLIENNNEEIKNNKNILKNKKENIAYFICTLTYEAKSRIGLTPISIERGKFNPNTHEIIAESYNDETKEK